MFMDNLSENMQISIAVFFDWVVLGHVPGGGNYHLKADVAKWCEWSCARTISLSSMAFYSQVVHLGFDPSPTSV